MTDDRPGNDPVEDALRSALSAHARRAPSADAVVRRVLAETGADDPRDELAARRRHRSLRTWALPLAAAGLVAALVGALVGIRADHTTAGPAATQVATPSPSLPASHVAGPAPVVTVTVTPGASPSTVSAGELTDLKIDDLTFYSQDAGWALGSANCLPSEGPGRCTALLHTTDGKKWSFVGNEEFNVPGVHAGCANKCVEHIRFASPSVGYVYGHDALFMTTDGGQNWIQQPGQGADALETLQGNVIAVRTGADPLFEQSANGHTTWTKITQPAASSLPTSATSVTLTRVDGEAVLAIDTPGTPTLYRSVDAGTSWQQFDDPCTSPLQASAATLADDGTIVLTCVPTGSANTRADNGVAVSTDGAGSFTVHAGAGLLPAAPLLTAAASDRILVAATSDGVYRSITGGANWTKIPSITGTVTFVGFEGSTDGRIVADDGRTIWTTQDGGASWSPVHFG